MLNVLEALVERLSQLSGSRFFGGGPDSPDCAVREPAKWLQNKGAYLSEASEGATVT